MNRQTQPFFGYVVAALAFTLLGASSVPTLPVSKTAAMIFNPGNGDYSGFRVVVEPDGRAMAVDAAGRATNELQSDLVDQFFKDLAEAAPAARVSAKPCADTSAAPTPLEVNAAISIAWKDRNWPDLRCAGDPRTVKLSADATAIEHALYVQAYRERTIAVYVGNRGGYSPPGAPQGGNVYGVYPAAMGAGGYSGKPFSTIGSYAASPFSTNPLGYAPYGGLPTTGIPGSLPTASLPVTNPYSSLPTSGLPGSSPYSSGPFNATPYGGGF